VESNYDGAVERKRNKDAPEHQLGPQRHKQHTSNHSQPEKLIIHLSMSSTLVKDKLKAAKNALNKKEFQSAHDTSLQILEYEPKNYHAYVSSRAAIPRC
jgi:hypothetical protein